MPEDELETGEVKEHLDEATEHAHHAEGRARWITYLSLTTALLAQTKAADQWAYYQAKSVKGTIYAAQAAQLQTSMPEVAEHAKKEAERYAREEEEISKTANELEKHVNEDSERSNEAMEHHHRFAYAVTMFQISIALAAVAALSRQKAVWYAGLGVAVIGIVYFIDGFRLFF